MSKTVKVSSRIAGAPAALLASLALAAPAWAESDSDGAVADVAAEAVGKRQTVYQQDYFTQFAPTNALDIVRRVPGFAIEETNDAIRGFSGAAGNVVFNGARPSSKAETLAAMLARIPARRVLRVEVAPGDVYGTDYAGKSQVLNVVLSREGGIDGTATASVRRLHDGSLIPDGTASVLIRSGKSTFNLSAKSGRAGDVEVGYDDVRLYSDNSRLELREKTNDIDFYYPRFAAGWAHEDGASRSAHLNLSYSPGRTALFQANHVIPTGGAQRDDQLEQDYRDTAYELGGDVTRPLGGGAIKLVALGNRRDRNYFDSYYERPGGTATIVGGFEQFQKARYDEVLGRLSWSHPKLAGFSAEFGSEVAYNKLENATELYLLGPAGARTRIDLPIDKATVDEFRTQTFANLGRQLTSALRLDTSLAFETSKLKVRGDTTADRSLSFLKPGITLDWKGAKGWHAQASMRREVAQLDFYDFISSAELANGRISGGNADLMPQRTWQARFTVERPVLGQGLIKLELGYDWASMLQDRVLTDDGFDAPGNIGNGTRKFAAFTFDAPLEKLGLKATRITINATVQDTSVLDPLSGKRRGWSGFYPVWEWSVDLRRDLAHWSYGVFFTDRADNVFYRIEEVDSLILERIYGTAFVEYRPDKRTTLRLDIDNAFDTAGQRYREFSIPNRSAATPTFTEFRHRDAHAAVTFSITRTFGGKG